MGQYIGLENKKILVAEDVELNQYLARHIMESWGCKVEIAENGALAVEKLKAQDFDLVLMDIQMPVMDGMEATRQIRKMTDEKKSTVPVVAFTANATEHEYDQYKQAGMNDCMRKPFEEASLFELINRNICKNKNVALYDLTMVEAISGGDRSFVTKMVQLFLDTVPATLNDIDQSLKAKEWAALGRHAHKLKSTIDSMGIISLKQDIRSIESNGKAGTNLDEMPGLVSKVKRVIHEVMEQVRRDHQI